MATPLTEEERLNQACRRLQEIHKFVSDRFSTDVCLLVQEKEKYVKIISSDDVVFMVEKKAASVSSTIKKMLTSDGMPVADFVPLFLYYQFRLF